MSSNARKWQQRLGAIAIIAISAALLALVVAHLPVVGDALAIMNDGAYDAAYRLRDAEVQENSEVVCLEADDASLKEVDELIDCRWPWPRELWGRAIHTLAGKGAKAVVFDLLFSEKAVLGSDDDTAFGKLIDESPIPVIVAVAGSNGRFVVPTAKPPVLGDADTSRGNVSRAYASMTARGESLALATLNTLKITPKLPIDSPFLIRYFGPHRFKGKGVIPAYPASRIVLEPNLKDESEKLPASNFKDKIVIIGTTAAATHDLKASPISARYPGVEIHATAMLNLIRGEQVRMVGSVAIAIITINASLVIAAGVIAFRSAAMKVLSIGGVTIVILLICIKLMLDQDMIWLPIAQPLVGMTLAALGALVWTYRIEDARSRFLLKALGQCISADVAKELALDPSKLSVGGRQQEMSILFSDIEGFTALTEKIGERIEPVLNLYLAEMSQTALDRNGTIDKFIGDAIMAFWNAPLNQPDHARRACETALKIVERERELSAKLAELGANRVFTRIGIHTGPVVVGFFGSKQRLSYTAIGDSVNLAARLEPCNKLYGTQIMVSQDTLDACDGGFLFRQIDCVRVYGRDKPVAIFELMAFMPGSTVDQKWLAEQSKLAISAYHARDWNNCLALVDEILHRFPNDGPAKVWRSRAMNYRDNPPPAEWDGVCEAKTK